MKNKKFLVAIMAIIILVSALTGCSRNGSNATATHIGASKTSKDTISAVLTNADYTSGITLNWASRVGKSSATLTGLQQIAFILDGDEVMDGVFKDRSLSSITLDFTGQTSGKKVSLSTSLTGKITNLGADNDYFRMDGNTIQFYPHYFSVGEEVTVKATFIYKGEGFVDQLMDSKSAEGYFTFTVGEDTGETFSNAFDKIGDFFKDFGKGNGNTGDNGSDNGDGNGSETGETPTEGNDFLSIRFSVDGTNTEGTVARYEDDAKKNVTNLPSSTAKLTFQTREDSRYNITKAYIVPVGLEGNYQKLAWCNDYFSDNCHKFDIDLSQFSGQTITLRLEFLDGAEWNPMPDHYYGFITVKVP